eukprot:Rhum_TRINITY_DN8201_c0_g1::Rhum_TRINITY_DN8201_c0_g1_i1::g.26744::m.26744
MSRRRVFSAPPSQRPPVMPGGQSSTPEQEIEQLKAQLIMLQMATGQASVMEAQLLTQGGIGTPTQAPLGSPMLDPSRKTPWFPSGAPFPTSISEEVVAFTRLISLDQQERDQRDAVILSVAYSAIQIWPHSKLVVDGSYASGTSEPSAPLQLIISNCRNLKLEDVTRLAVPGHAMHTSMVEKAEGATGPKIGKFEIVSNNGIVVKATLTEGRDHGKARRRALTKALDEVPHSRTLSILLRHVLYHSCATLVGDAPGALPLEALLVMCIFICRRSGGYDPGNALVTFLKEIGKEIDLKEVSLNPKGYTQKKLHPDAQLSVLAPEDPSVNLAAGCTCLRMIRGHLQSFCSALKAFNPQTALTPLSTMIAHRPLWRRVNGLQARSTPESSLAVSPEANPAQLPLGMSPSAISGASASQGMTPDSPLLIPEGGGPMEFGRTQSLMMPRSPPLMDLAQTQSCAALADLAAKFPQQVTQNPVYSGLTRQFSNVVSQSQPSSVINSPVIEDLKVMFPMNVRGNQRPLQL